jgi:hypothetical protein
VTVNQGSQPLASLAVGQTTSLNIWYLFSIQIDSAGNAQISTIDQFQSGSSSTILCVNVATDECGTPRSKN